MILARTNLLLFGIATGALAAAPACSEDAAPPAVASPPAPLASPLEDEALLAPAPGDRVLALERFMRAQRLEQLGAADAALDAVGQALAADPACAEALLLRARMRLEDGAGYDPLAALRDSRLARLAQPEDGNARATEGLVRYVLDDSGRARPLLEGSVALPADALKPGTRAAAEEALGFLALRRGDSDDAARRLAAALALRPGRAFTHYGIALVAGERGDVVAKEAALHDALRLDPHLLAARLELFQLYLRSGRREEAEREKQVFERLRRLRDDTSQRFADDHRAKAELWGEIVRLLPTEPATRWQRVRELVLAKDLAAAAAEGEAALKEGVVSPELIVATARAQARLGRAEAARATAAATATLDPPPAKELQAALRDEIERLLQAAPATAAERSGAER